MYTAKVARRPVLGLLAVLAAVPAAWPGSLPDAVVVLDVLPEPRPGLIPEAAPARFALMPGGTVYVGGSSRLAVGRLEKGEAKGVEKQVSKVRKLSGLGSTVRLGPGAKRYRLAFRKGLVIAVHGDPSQAPSSLRPLAALLESLETFDHPSLRPYTAAQLALFVQPATAPGGCRGWAFPFTPAELATGPRAIPAESAGGWPTGSGAAWVCAPDRTYLAALRPLIPGERP